IGLDDVIDIAEVPAGFAVAIDDHFFVTNHGGYPARNHGRVSAIGVLPAAEYVEIAQPHCGRAIRASEYVGVQLVHILGDGIRREGPSDGIFHLWQTWMIAIGGA